MVCSWNAEHTLHKIAEQMGITRERVRQIQMRADEKVERRVAAMGFGERQKPAVAEPVRLEFKAPRSKCSEQARRSVIAAKGQVRIEWDGV